MLQYQNDQVNHEIHPREPAPLQDSYRHKIPADHLLYTPTNDTFPPGGNMNPPKCSFSEFVPETPTSDWKLSTETFHKLHSSIGNLQSI